MRAYSSRRTAGLALLTSIVGCGAGTRAQEDVLWRAYWQPAHSPADANAANLFANADELERRALVEAVLARNPSVDAAREGLRAKLAEIPQATALDDPMV